jgi:protein SCO1/2
MSLAVFMTAVLALAACASGATGTSSGAASIQGGVSTNDSGNGNDDMDIALPPNIVNLPLLDPSGRAEPLSAFKGKVIVVSDVMTLCQETCPLDTANLVQAARAVEKAGLGDQVEFLSVTIDPQRDTPAQLAAYRQLFAPPPADWATLTGAPDNLAALWKNFGVWSQKVPESNPPAKNWRTGETLTYDLDHSDDVFFIDQNLHEQTLLDGPAHVVQGTQLPSALQSYLSDTGHQNLEHPSADAWTTQQVLQIVSGLVHHSIPQ